MASGITQNDSDTINWIIGVGLFVGVVAFIASTSEAGHALVYWSLMLLIVLLIVTQYKWIAQEFSFVNFSPPTYRPGTTNAAGQTTYSTFAKPSFGPAGIIPV